MGKGIIIYQSKYGATKKYAEWLREAAGFDVIETSKADSSLFEKYDRIILCGGIYASGIAGLAFLRKNRQALAGKKAAVFCVGASPYDEKALKEVKELNLKEDLKEIPMFYGRGAWMKRPCHLKTGLYVKYFKKQLRRRILPHMNRG